MIATIAGFSNALLDRTRATCAASTMVATIADDMNFNIDYKSNMM
jgi:hypothetical protein